MAATGSDTPAPLLTERLLLRPLTADDAGALLRFRAHPAATRYLSHGPLTPAQNRARLEQALSAAAASTAEWFHFGWAIELRATGEVVGDGRTWNTQEPPAPGRIPADQPAWATFCTRITMGSASAGRPPAPWSTGFSAPAAARPFSRGSTSPISPRAGCWRAWASGRTASSRLPRTQRESSCRPGATGWTAAACPAPTPATRTCPVPAPRNGHNALMPTPAKNEHVPRNEHVHSPPALPHRPADMSSAQAREWTQCPHAHSRPPRMSMSRGSSEHVHSWPPARGMSGGDKARRVCHSVTIQRRGRHGDKLG